MTLLDATATLIDFAKSNATESDRVVAQAVKRMEKRLRLLQLRRAKTIRWNRRKAFWQAIGELGGGADMKRQQGVLICPKCEYQLNFGDFLKSSTITGHGAVKSLICPKCSGVLLGEPPEDEL